MPPTLDLTRTSHTKMIVSPPRINLRRATSYNKHDAPLSSTSSRFNFNHLVFASPPPSPGLPSLSPPLKKPKKGIQGFIRPTRVIRLVIWALGSFLIFQVVSLIIQHAPNLSSSSWTSGSQDGYEMVGQDRLPDFPTPVVVTDKRGRAKWTVSIPSNYDFPLSPAQYADVCAKCREVSDRVQALRSHSHGLPQNYLSFGSASPDSSFVDVQEAEAAGYLPGRAGREKVLGKQAQGGDVIGESKDGLVEVPVCQRSMTFVLESQDAGMGHSLLTLWTAYGLAQKEGRAFFIDDTRWAYGKYTDIFLPPPIPECRPPPRHEMLPCPRQARHLMASSATFSELLGGLEADMEGSGESDDSLRKALFALAREGHDALFKINKGDALMVPKTRGKQNGIAIGLHVRRGDRHPFEYQYQNSYIPLDLYTDAARDILEDRFNHTGPRGGEDVAAKEHSFLVLASDDPTVYESAQERIKLASKQAIQSANQDRGVMKKFVDETFGWEGGFFSAMFWNLGVSGMNSANAKAPGTMAAPSSETIRLRSLVGRAYMMDLSVLADSSDVVICTVSSMGCRLLAVMMGWEDAVEQGNWVNIDGGYSWMGIS
ncbi:hypothetical protein GQ53DRAFT_810412 [Thozetella sp. PMI_491]|nr:hypothetical protein GQ53DRAFT_810412 [Thozetella sp. PMI_491]